MSEKRGPCYAFPEHFYAPQKKLRIPPRLPVFLVGMLREAIKLEGDTKTGAISEGRKNPRIEDGRQ
jgi:hypothetical protein